VAETTSEMANDVIDKLKYKVLSFNILLSLAKAQTLVTSHK
jgi:hypothetical protein